jgi:hypothetical protein
MRSLRVLGLLHWGRPTLGSTFEKILPAVAARVSALAGRRAGRIDLSGKSSANDAVCAKRTLSETPRYSSRFGSKPLSGVRQ